MVAGHKQGEQLLELEKNYTIREAAGIFKRRVKTLYGWIREGRIFEVVIKVGDGYLIPASEIRRVLDSGRIKTAPHKENDGGRIKGTGDD